MILGDNELDKANSKLKKNHAADFSATADMLARRGYKVEQLLEKIGKFQVATPSWAMGTGGTRFGRFGGGGEPATLEQKIDDAGLLKSLSQSTSSISLHIPWDIPSDPKAIKQQAKARGLSFDAVNSNTFQDQPDAKKSYKFGSLCNTEKTVRDQAIAHNIEVIEYGKALGSKALTIWLADGSNYPGQQHFRKAFDNTLDSLKKIYKALPKNWKMFTEHKPYEPNFYSSVVADWGSSLLLAEGTGDRCLCLVDLGHHLPNCNIEQVVSRLLMKGRLAGFHFNDSKYSDDDLTTGCMKPYQLFLIFNELVEFLETRTIKNPPLSWMIDESHNTKDPLEDLLQSIEAIKLAYAQALLIDRKALWAAQQNNDPVTAQEILQGAYRTDVRPLLAEARLRNGGAIDPINAFRELRIRETLISERGYDSTSTGL